MRFPDCHVALLAGSAAQGIACDTSDLDMIIFHESPAGTYRETYRFSGWIVEAFVVTQNTFESLINAAVETALPSLLRMCAEGVIIHDDGSAAAYIERAKQALDSGPEPLLPEEIDRFRYEITNALLDLTSSQSRAEHLFIVGPLTQMLATFILRTHSQWSSEGKWAWRALVDFDQKLGESLVSALEQLYVSDDPSSLETFIQNVLAPYGGLLTAGYWEWGGTESD